MSKHIFSELSINGLKNTIALLMYYEGTAHLTVPFDLRVMKDYGTIILIF